MEWFPSTRSVHGTGLSSGNPLGVNGGQLQGLVYDRIWDVLLNSRLEIVHCRSANYIRDTNGPRPDQLVGSPLSVFFEGVSEKSAQLALIYRHIREMKSFSGFRVDGGSEASEGKYYSVTGHPYAPSNTGDIAELDGLNGAIYCCRIGELTTFISEESRKREVAAFFEALLAHSPNFIVVKDIEGRYLFINSVAEKVLGKSLTDVFGKLPSESLGDVKAAECAKHDHTVLEKEAEIHLEQVFNVEGEKRSFRVVKFPAVDSVGCMVGVCAVGVDVTKAVEVDSHKEYFNSNFDYLTEIPNRYLALDRLRQALAQSKRGETLVGLLVLDLGRFSSINDSFGTDIGDSLLVETAWRLKLHTRESDTVARMSGDQFAVILTGCEEPADIDLVTEKILAALKEPYFTGSQDISISPSIGVALCPQDSAEAAGLLSCAEAALELAKGGGRNAVTHYNSAESDDRFDRERIALQLDNAINNGEFDLVYQPLICSRTNKVVSAEALLRWSNGELGQVSPATFIPIAENNGKIHEIGAWVIGQACEAAAVWNAMSPDPIPVSVNVSPVQMADERFVDVIRRALDASGLDIRHLKLEVTETAFAENSARFKQCFFELADMGIGLSLDDFGTGYSSLGYLSDCPFDVLKIDKVFVDQLATRDESRALLASIIEMARSLRMCVVAEGVETAEQVKILSDLECDHLQGYIYSRPLLVSEFQSYVRNRALNAA